MLRTNYWKKGILLSITAVLVIVLAAGCGKKNQEAAAPGAGEGKVVATYTDGTVTETEFKKYSTFFGIVQPQTEMYLSIPQLQEQFLREYVGYKVLFKKLPVQTKDEAAKSKTDVDAFYAQIKKAIDGTPATKTKVEAAKLTESDIRYFYSMITRIMANEESKVTDAEVKKQYETTKDDYNVISVRHILIGTVDPQTGAEKRKDADALKIAKEVKAKLDAGGDWKALAKQYSDDAGSKENGGLYENQQAKGWVAEFKDAANKQAIGKVGDPVKSSFGYHVMKVEKREPTAFEKLTAADLAALKQAVASTNMNNFMTKDLPKLITKITLPEAAKTGTGKTNDTTKTETKTETKTK
ncbi:foldase protein PrsA 4 [Paenibacillus baekrokdamisoli]|uniref:Foldase protein PrsA 4 n=1 Tax=Paenibacillus baekrokdamisoli TaxID=1712516 RepID=A0A3G9JEE5_9BACL|nr:peptidylprolyl isomerase [Paenibacillus baekrokdamisoli]MBB3072988.1 foldase protein PrsA [Paenibacillus baekrokdamisoli]BBH23343.1 foldase protein PrsA 4 [Paenibacillus baekrokdamisoli]